MLGTTVLNKWHYGALGVCLSFSSVVQADISGSVFRDFNANGAFDSSASFAELGVAGVTVKAFDNTGAVATIATSNSLGAYNLTGLTAGANYRLEFTWAENWLKPGTATGGSNTQFVKDGASSANLALSSPDEYSQDNPQIATSNFLVGEPTSANVTGKPGVLEFAYRSGAAGRDFAVTASGSLQDEVTDIAISAAPNSAGTGNAAAATVAGRSKIINATLDQIGPIYGLAYHRNSNQLLAAAFMKRFTGFPGGTSSSKLGTIYKIDRSTNPNTVAPFFTANTGNDVHDYSSSDLGTPTGDTAAGNQAAKAGWGDIDLSTNGKTLYAINLFDKKIYAIPVSGSGSSLAAGTATPISFPSSVTSGLCSNDEWVPGGVKTYRNEVYVTVTCTAETSQLAADLKFFVYKLPQGASSPFTQVASMVAPERDNGAFNQQWKAWTNTATLDGVLGATNDPNRYIYPQPWAMDLEFDEFGKLYLGIRNRSSDMRAAFNDAGQPSYEYGDTQVGLPNTDGTYTMLASTQPAPYEFIDDFTTSGGEHPENDMGALAVIAGTKEIITPANIGNSIQGIRTYSTVDATTTTAKSGIPLRYYGITQGTNVAAAGNPFGKVAGLGDLEILSAPAPIEVGDRVWSDTDKDGIQDADEPGLENVNVSLVCGPDTASAVTNTSGQFIFVNTSGGNASFMQAEEDCVLRVDNTQAALTAKTLTTANADGDSTNNALTDLRDSDASTTANFDEISFKVGNAGENNHSLDFGYREPLLTDLALTKTVAPAQAKRGEQAVYTLTVTNQSTTIAATNIKIADQLPAGVTYVSDDGLAQQGADVFDEAIGVWMVDSLAVGATKTLKITVQVQ